MVGVNSSGRATVVGAAGWRCGTSLSCTNFQDCEETLSTDHESRFISIALAPRQRCLDPAQAVTHVRELMLEMFEPVDNRLVVA
jgi:hypothetical protein